MLEFLSLLLERRFKFNKEEKEAKGDEKKQKTQWRLPPRLVNLIVKYIIPDNFPIS